MQGVILELRQVIKRKQTWLEMLEYEKSRGNTHYYVKNLEEKAVTEALLLRLQKAIEILQAFTTAENPHLVTKILFNHKFFTHPDLRQHAKDLGYPFYCHNFKVYDTASGAALFEIRELNLKPEYNLAV